MNGNDRFNGFVDNNLFSFDEDVLNVDKHFDPEVRNGEYGNEEQKNSNKLITIDKFNRNNDVVKAEIIFDDCEDDKRQFAVKDTKHLNCKNINEETLDDNLPNNDKNGNVTKKETHEMVTFKKDQYSSIVGDAADNTIKLKQTVKEIEYNTIDNISSLGTGEILKQARELCGLDFAEVEDITKIKKSYIIALEDDDFSNMPPFVYTSAYLRTLCEVYSLAPEYAKKIIDRVKLDRSVQISERLDNNADQENEQDGLDDQDKKVIFWFAIVGIVILSFIGLGTMLIVKSCNSDTAKITTTDTPVANAVTANTGFDTTTTAVVPIDKNVKFNREKFSKLLPSVQLKEDELPMEK